MPFQLNEIVPWGRNLDEYRRMLSLTEENLSSRILGCGDGPASFNAELSAMGGRVISYDPIYAFSIDQMRERIEEVTLDVLRYTEENRHRFIWEDIESLFALGNRRGEAMNRFLEDFEAGKEEGRYVAGDLPFLPFGDDSFDLALSSHFLILYTHKLSFEFHLDSIREILRVSPELRIFPLLDMDGNRSNIVDKLMELSGKEFFSAEVQKVNYEFQKGGNEMMIIKKIPSKNK